MLIISHRGYWKNTAEKNAIKAFQRSFSLGFGTETDIRDFHGKLVISHDIANGNSINFDRFLTIYRKYNVKSPLALNIKADGLKDILMKSLKKHKISDYFVFDMSIPEQIQYIKKGLKTYTRQSEYEKSPALYDGCTGVWLDGFDGDWYSEDIISNHLKKGKAVCVVSPELHMRNPMPLWKRLREMKFIKNKNFILCTDYPERAKRYFDGED